MRRLVPLGFKCWDYQHSLLIVQVKVCDGGLESSGNVEGGEEVHITKEHILSGCVVKGEVTEKVYRIKLSLFIDNMIPYITPRS